ncbi:MAG: polysaccharide biosynthesis/export family protein [Bacteroidales bacterium]|nr:polysaccharide biosynthesis/export family protein [Bacteroidales bacterium]
MRNNNIQKGKPFRRITLLVLSSCLMVSLAACSSTQERYHYVADAPLNTPMPITNNYDATIYAGDQLYIYVGSAEPSSVRMFNEESNRKVPTGATSTTYLDTVRYETRGYLVSQSGCIMFPVLGRLEVKGMTREELGRDIERRLIDGGYVKDPVVTVNIMNFHVAVIGEVKAPKIVLADGSRLTIFEALAQAGDITIDGLRTNVVVVRNHGDGEIVDTLDLTRKEVLDSPYYYLQQNDIVYVEPTEEKKKKAWRNEDWPSYISLSTSALRVAYTVIYRIAISTN